MKKLLAIVVLGLLFSGNAYAKKTKLKCQGLLDKVEGDIVYVNFDNKIIEIFQGSGGNKVKFKIKTKNDQEVTSYLRGVLSNYEDYDTHVSDWDHWDFKEYKKHLYAIQIDRVGGYVNIMRTVKPWKQGKKDYDLEVAGEGWGMVCKKAGSKF
jgi:hypothetical protein